MAKYTFLCESCGEKRQFFLPAPTLSTTSQPCKCGQIMQLQMPVLAGQSEVRETVDSHTGVKWQEDHQKTINDRKRTYFWEVEVPRMVNSGVYSIETMLENRWVYYDEKGNLVTRTTPPEAE